MMVLLHQCAFCKHFQGQGVKPLCEAFPKGIPAAIFNNAFDHHMPFPGDNGIRFEKSEYFVRHFGVLNLSDMEKKLFPNWHNLYAIAPEEATERAEEFKAQIRHSGLLITRGALTREQYYSLVHKAINQCENTIAWRCNPDYSVVQLDPLDTCPGCGVSLKRWSVSPYQPLPVVPEDSEYVNIISGTMECPRCGKPIYEEHVIAYEPNCDICGRQAGPGKRVRSVLIDEVSPRRWKCEECDEADKLKANEP